MESENYEVPQQEIFSGLLLLSILDQNIFVNNLSLHCTAYGGITLFHSVAIGNAVHTTEKQIRPTLRLGSPSVHWLLICDILCSDKIDKWNLNIKNEGRVTNGLTEF
jgi:hypothetical protein